MSDTIISVERLSKRYKLGQIGATTLRDSVERWWTRMRARGGEVAELSSCQVEGEAEEAVARLLVVKLLGWR